MRIKVINLRKLWLSLLLLVGATAIAIPGIQEVMDGNVAKVGSTEYATIEEAIAAWGPGKTLTLLDNVTTTSTVVVEVNATKSTQNWTLDLGDYTWTASGCNAFRLYAAGGTVMNQNYGLKIYANQNGGITASGKYCIECTYDVASGGYRPRLEIHGGTYNGSSIVFYKSLTSNNTSVTNGPSTHFFKSNDGTEPVFNGNFALAKCPITIYAGYFNGTSFNTYPVNSTANTNLNGGHFKTIGAFPSASNNKGIVFGNYKVFVKSDASIDVINGAPATYEAKATKTLLLSSNQSVNYSDYVYYEKADDAINKYSSGTIEIILNNNVTATQNKSFSSGTLTIDATAEGSEYTGTITLSGNNAKFVIKFPEGGGHYGVKVNSGSLHVVETIENGIVTRTYSRVATVSNPEAKVGNTSYSTVYDAFYAVDGSTDNKTIVLQKNVTNAGIVTNGTAASGDGKTVATFDLNGKSIGIGSVAAGNNADYTLTIIDSSEGKTGTVTNSDASLLILALTGINDYSGTYTLKIQAGTWQFDPSNVVINGETHNLVDEGYVAHDNGNGTWTVGETAKVAQIGETKYATLQAAVDAAQQMGGAVTVNIIDDISGETVTIKEVANFKLTIDGKKDESSNYTVDAVIVVDGLRGNGGSITNGASVTLQNIAFVKTTATDGIQASHYPHNLTIQDCTYSGSDSDKWFLNASVDGPLYGVTVKNVTVEHARLIYANMAEDAVFQNITAINDVKVGFNVKTSGTALIENCQVTTGKYAFRDYSDAYEGIFTLKGNTFNSTSEASDEGVIVNRGGAVGTAHINVESGTYTGHLKVMNNKEGVLAISGGYFSEEFPQEYIAADLVAQGKVCAPAADMEGYYTVGDPHYVAQIGETKYVSLAAAVEAAQAGDVITMIDDDNLSLTAAGSEIVINKPLTITGAVDENGKPKFTIYGSANGALSNSSFNDLFISCSTGTVTISNLKFDGFGNEISSVMGHSPVFIGSSNNNAVIENVYISNLNCEGIHINGGTFTIKDCNIDCSKTTNSIFTKGICVVNAATGSIENTTITGVDCNDANDTSAAIELQGSGDIAISGCTIESETIGIATTPVGELTAGTSQVTVSDCTVTSHNIAVYSNGDKGALTSISSGRYSGLLMAGDNNEGLSISGGIFDDMPEPAYCAENYIPTDNTDEATKEAYPYTIKVGQYVAEINGTMYETLQEAWENVQDGETITLLADCSGNGIKAPQGKFTNGVTIDFDGHTYTMDGDMVGSSGTETQAFQLLKDNKITFKNGTIYSEKAKMLVQNYSDLTLEGMTLTLNNANYTEAYTLSNNNGNVVIDGTTINANPAGGFAFDVCRYASYPSVSVIVKSTSEINGDIQVDAGSGDPKDGMFLTVEGGTINGDLILTDGGASAITNNAEKAVVKKNNDVTLAAPQDYKWVDNGDGTSTLAPCVYVAQIGDDKYESLAAAVAAVPADGTETTITMIANEMINVVGSAVTIPATKNVVLDLNGFQVVGTATGGSTSALITNKGSLTIKDSSDTNKDGTGTGQLISGATNTWIYEGDGNYAGSYASNTITNSGTLTIESGYIENLSTGSATYAVDNNSSGADAILNVNGGLMKAHSVAVRQFANSTTLKNEVNIAGGTVTAGYSGIWIQLPGSDATKAMKASLNVTGGTLSGGSYAFYDYSYGNSFDATQYNLDGGTFDGTIFSYGANIAITDGTYKGEVAVKQTEPSVVTVSGGRFSDDVYTYGANASEGFITGGVFAINTYEYEGNTYDCDWLYLLADGYVVSDNTDPETKDAYPYAVRQANYICAIGTTKYETLADAVAAAGTAETTITLLTEAATDGVISGDGVVVPTGSNITFDLNGLTYDVSGETVGSSGTESNGFQLLQGSDITFKNGTLKATAPKAQMLIQNYSNLTLEDVNLDGTTLSGWAYALSNNCGSINLTGSTSITAKTGGRAFDTCKYASYAIPTVNINTTGAISGPIEATGGKLNIENGKFDVTWVTDANYSAGDIQITGGVFSAEPAEEYCADGYVTTDNEDAETKDAYPYAVMSKEDAGIFELIDGEIYPYLHYTEDKVAASVTYKRNFTNKNWQALFVPFDINDVAELTDRYEFAKIHMVALENDGTFTTGDKIEIYYTRVTSGKLSANQPYLIKAKNTGWQNIVVENTILKDTHNMPQRRTSTMAADYVFTGTYEGFSGLGTTKYEFLAMGGGTINWGGKDTKLGTYRWYIKPEPYDDDYAKPSFSFIEIDEEATGISAASTADNAEIEGYYTVNGVRSDVPVKGMNIVKYKNGKTKKIMIK